ncbi:hypothetical protein ACFE04_003220 [Oxalis oulophora]
MMTTTTSKNPRIQNWRFTWETQTLSPNLRLFLFNPSTIPSIHCRNLHVSLQNPHLLIITWIEQNDAVPVSINVPIPRVLFDVDAPISFKALDDHIEIKLVLLLPVDHPVVVSMLYEDEDDFGCSKTLVMDYDTECLSAMNGVDFYCRSCSNRLNSSPIRDFVEMPSENWQEAADNWFGGCCTSFNGASEKLVAKFANAYNCVKGTCYLTSTTVTIHKEDFVGCDFLAQNGSGDSESETSVYSESNYKKIVSENGKMQVVTANSEDHRNVESAPSCCAHGVESAGNSFEMLRIHEDCETSSLNRKYVELAANQKSFLNGYLGNIFMVKPCNRSKSIQWIEFSCPQCSALLGAYPHSSGHALVDDGVRLFKYSVSVHSPVGRSSEMFRKYSLEKMFANRLVENAKEELSFRTVVRDLTTKSPLLQVILLNPNSWCSTGYCLDAEKAIGSISKLELDPVVKILFFDYSNGVKSQARILEDFVTKNKADEVFMLRRQIEELIESLVSSMDILPSSCSSFQGLPLSSLRR